jgi:glucosamine--fructose-6-phosphate aminotransferase (isomerizing)
MCGIVGRIGLEHNCKITLEGIKELQYRGYDSFGILFSNGKSNKLVKKAGEPDDKLIKTLELEKSTIEIGHTRWATHGKATQNNAHPHSDESEECFVVMNGIIENHTQIKQLLSKEGISFTSETDTEVIPHLFMKYYNESREEVKKEKAINALQKVLSATEGEFSFLLKYKNILIGYKFVNPIIVGRNKNELFISSDLNVVQDNTEEYTVNMFLYFSKKENSPSVAERTF